MAARKANTKITKAVPNRPPFECIALVLQGGGALGAYQCGVYEALSEANLAPDWLAGISIGAINAALIAGNPPETRVARMREFWEGVTSGPAWPWMEDLQSLFLRGEVARTLFGEASAASSALGGAKGFFAPRMPPPWMQLAGSAGATSFYDTTPLRGTLERLVDFDRINSGALRLSVGAVDVESGNFAYFDSTTTKICVDHILASGALPPGFAPVEIDGRKYWDGGLVSNTPLQWVVDAGPRQNTLTFQVDLWSARGSVPQDLPHVYSRQKEILYSSRTREQTDRFKEYQRLCRNLADLLDALPPDLRKGPTAAYLSKHANRSVYNIVQLIYRARSYEGNASDYEFSRLAMQEHWKSGYEDAVRTLAHPEILIPPSGEEGVVTFDLANEPVG